MQWSLLLLLLLLRMEYFSTAMKVLVPLFYCFHLFVVVHRPNGRNAENEFPKDRYFVVCLGVHGRNDPMDALLAIGVSKGILKV